MTLLGLKTLAIPGGPDIDLRGWTNFDDVRVVTFTATGTPDGSYVTLHVHKDSTFSSAPCIILGLFAMVYAPRVVQESDVLVAWLARTELVIIDDGACRHIGRSWLGDLVKGVVGNPQQRLPYLAAPHTPITLRLTLDHSASAALRLALAQAHGELLVHVGLQCLCGPG